MLEVISEFFKNEKEVNIPNTTSVKQDIAYLRALTEELDKKDREVEKLQEMYQNLFYSLWNGIVILRKRDNHFIIEDLNDSAKKINGFYESCVGSEVSYCLHDQEMYEKIQKVYENNSREQLIITEYNNNDELRYYFYCKIYKLSTNEIVLIFEDRTEEAKKERLNNKREKMLQCSLNTSRLLLQDKINGQEVRNILEDLRQTTDTTKAYIYKNVNEEKAVLCSHIDRDDNYILKEKLYLDKLPNLKESLKSGHYFCDDSVEKSSREIEICNKVGIKSFCIVPIYLNHEWWGFLGFEDKETKKNWTFDDINILTTISDMLGILINRVEK